MTSIEQRMEIILYKLLNKATNFSEQGMQITLYKRLDKGSSYWHLTSVMVVIMTLFTVMENLRHRWTWICFLCRGHNAALISPVLTFHLICLKSNLTGATTGTGSPEFVTLLSGAFVVHIVQIHVVTFLVMCCYVRYKVGGTRCSARL